MKALFGSVMASLVSDMRRWHALQRNRGKPAPSVRLKNLKDSRAFRSHANPSGYRAGQQGKNRLGKKQPDGAGAGEREEGHSGKV